MIRVEVTRAHDIDVFGVTPVVLITVWLGARPLLRWSLDTDTARSTTHAPTLAEAQRLGIPIPRGVA